MIRMPRPHVASSAAGLGASVAGPAVADFDAQTSHGRRGREQDGLVGPGRAVLNGVGDRLAGREHQIPGAVVVETGFGGRLANDRAGRPHAGGRGGQPRFAFHRRSRICGGVTPGRSRHARRPPPTAGVPRIAPRLELLTDGSRSFDDRAAECAATSAPRAISLVMAVFLLCVLGQPSGSPRIYRGIGHGGWQWFGIRSVRSLFSPFHSVVPVARRPAGPFRRSAVAGCGLDAGGSPHWLLRVGLGRSRC